MNILNFNEWKSVNEKFNAEIKDDEKNDIDDNNLVDNIIVKETENSEPIIYSIEGGSITSNQKQTIVDVKGKHKKTSKKDKTEVTDTQLKTDIKKAAYAIRDIKDRLYAEEILRVTGGDITNTTDDIRVILDASHKEQGQNFENNDDANSPSLSASIAKQQESNTNSPFTYISIPQNENWEGKYTLTPKNIKDIYDAKSHTIGKGEYLLPMLFSDVYKNQAYGASAKGDNYFIAGPEKTKYIIEVKGPNACKDFTDYSKHGGGAKQYLKKSIDIIKNIGNTVGNNDNILDIRDIYKTAIASTLLDYASKQLNETYKQGYFCIFEEIGGAPVGIFLINISNIDKNCDVYINNDNKKDELTLIDHLKDKLEIITNSNYQTNADFQFTYSGGENGKIMCKLSKKHLETLQNIIGEEFTPKRKGPRSKNINTFEATILSRDEYATKK